MEVVLVARGGGGAVAPPAGIIVAHMKFQEF